MPSTEQLLVEIRARINYESFYRELLGDRLRRQGRELVAICPFHDDRSPSLSINPDTGLWLCRVPSCPGHAGGDFITFVRRVLNMDFPHAVRYVAERANVDVGESATARFTRIARENAAIDEDSLIADYRARLTEPPPLQPPSFIDEAIVDAYHRQLIDDDPRMQWLWTERGIAAQTVHEWRIGWTGERYTIPVEDADGHVVNIRQYKPNATEQKMISWREGYGGARLFPLPILYADGTIYIMEGEWDCLLARQLGLHAITTTAGSGVWLTEWNDLFGGYDVVICYDNDDAGRAGARMIADALSRSDAPSTVKFIMEWGQITGTRVADGYDFTDYIRGGYTVEHFQSVVAMIPPYSIFSTEPPSGPPPSVADVVQEIDDRINRTDVGNARRLARRHGDDVRYVSRNWYVWDGTRYALDETGEIDRRAKDTAQRILDEAATCPDDETRRKLASWSIASESASRIKAMIELAKSERPIAVPASAMDTDPWLLNCANGTYDFRVGDLGTHRREDLITMSTNQSCTPGAECPTWSEFVARTFDDNFNVIQFVQRAIGYSLIGVTTEQVLFFCYGTGANGKSTFLETIRDVVGDYARTADFSTFATQRGGHSGPRNDIMRLRNARFVTAIEFDAGRALDEIVIKQLTGGDTISARRLYSESEEFRPTFTPWIAGNHKPIIKGTDEAIWRRLRLIPFNVTIPHGERDPALRQRLLTEAPGILQWVLHGAMQWRTIGMQPPEEVLVATQAYRNEMDTVEPFLEQRTIREPRATIKASVLYAEYKRWAEESGEEAISKTAFGLRMGEKGYQTLNRGGTHYRIGVRLRVSDDLLEPTIEQTNGHHEETSEVVPFEPRIGPNW